MIQGFNVGSGKTKQTERVLILALLTEFKNDGIYFHSAG
jgi:hypothetical protein